MHVSSLRKDAFVILCLCQVMASWVVFGPVYTKVLLGENEEISFCYSLPFTPKRWKRQGKQRLLKTKTKVETLKTSVFLM